MAWDYFDVIGEGEKAVVDRLQDLLGVAAGEIGSADGAGEKGVTGNEEGLVGQVEAAAAVGVARGVDDGAGESDDGDRLAVLEVFVGGRNLGGGDA